MPRAKAIFKGLAFGLGGLVVVGAAAVAGGYAWINSDAGRSWLIAQIEDAASTPGEMELTIGTLEGSLPQALRARDIALGDGAGKWLTIAGLDVDWHPWSLLHRTLDIETLKLTGVDLARLPQSPSAPDAAADSTDGTSFDLPLAVRVGRLSADEIALGAPVLGQAARFTLAGEAGRRDDGSLSARLDLVRLDGPEARLLAALRYNPADGRLSAQIDASEAPGGLLAGVLERPDLPRTELRLHGEGPLADWHGDFALSLGDLASAEAAIGLAGSSLDDLGFSLQGHGDVTPPASADAWQQLAGRTTLDVQGSWQDGRHLQLERFIATNDRLSLALAGTVEPRGGALDLTLNAEAADGAPLAALLDLEGLGALTAEVALSGTTSRPRASLDLQATNLTTADFTAAAVTATGRVAAASDLAGEQPNLTLDLEGRVEAPRLPGQDEANEVLGDALAWRLAGTLDLVSGLLQLDELAAETDIARLTASGPFNINDGSGTLDTTAAVPELTRLQPLTGIGLGGEARLAGPLTLRRYGGFIGADLTGRWDRPASDIGLITAAAGSGLDIAARFTIEGADVVIEEAAARSPATDLLTSVTVSGGALRDGRYRLELADAAVLAPELGVATAGRAQTEGTIAGPFDALALDGTLQLERLTVEDQVLSDLAGRYDLRLAGANVDGPVSVALDSPYGRAEVSADLQVRDDAVTLAALRAQLPQATVSGNLAVPLDGRPIGADLTGDFADLGPWLEVAGVSGGGTGSARLQWHQPGTPAPLVLDAELSRLRVAPGPDAAPLRAERVTLALRAQDPALAEAGDIDLAAETLRWENLDLSLLHLAARGSRAALDVSLQADGRWIQPLHLEADARVTQQEETLSIALDKAAGELFGRPLMLREPARLTLAPEVTRLENLALASGDTTLNAEAEFGDGGIAATAVLDRLPLATVDAFWDSGLEGSVSAELDLAGSFAAPRGSARLSVGGLRPRGATDTPALALDASADWRDGRVAARGELGGAQVASARFTADAPLQLTPDGNLAVPPQAPLAGQLDWSGDIATLLLFVPLPEHRLNGDASIAVTLEGTLDAPQAEGRIALENGRYENLETGTILRALTLTAEATEERVTLSALSANDGAGGTLRGTGSFDIDPAASFPLDVSVTFDKFHALRRDDVVAVAGGTLTLAGGLDAPEVSGRFTTETVEISLLTSLPPNVVSLDIVEVTNGISAVPEEEAETPPPVDAILDIVVDMPWRVFVRGRGLDSEWAGRLSVQGPASAPAVTGELNLVRGFMSVIGKPFDLTAGKVSLPEGADNEPSLDVTAVHEGEELTVTARLSGTLSQPELDLSSMPEVPRDEIVSRVLFNKSAAQLTAAEAAQLAIALRDLTGQGGGADILGFARRTLGVDVLRIETSGTGTAVEAGKYLTDEVYLGVKQGATSQSSSAGVEVELTPNITIESEVTGSGASKSGVRFQWDY